MGPTSNPRDKADASGEYYPSIDQLTGEQLAFPNVLVLFAQHRFVNSTATIVEVETLFVEGRKGLLFRDGRQYDITWSTRKGELQLYGRGGRPDRPQARANLLRGGELPVELESRDDDRALPLAADALGRASEHRRTARPNSDQFSAPVDLWGPS